MRVRKEYGIRVVVTPFPVFPLLFPLGSFPLPIVLVTVYPVAMPGAVFPLVPFMPDVSVRVVIPFHAVFFALMIIAIVVVIRP